MELHKKERFLYNQLFIYNSENPSPHPLNLNTTVVEIEQHFDMRNWFRNERLKRKEVAPMWKTALEFWIYEIELYMLGIGYDDENRVNLDHNHHLINDVYKTTTVGKTRYLYEYSGSLVYEFKNGEIEKQTLIDVYLKDIARGVSIAHLLPELKTELSQLSEQGNKSIPNPNIEALDIRKDKDKLTTKQQIFLLNRLGIFELTQVQSLTEQKRGILFGHLLNRHEKNTEDTIRNRFAPQSEKIKKPVLDLLKELGIDK